MKRGCFGIEWGCLPVDADYVPVSSPILPHVLGNLRVGLGLRFKATGRPLAAVVVVIVRL